MAESSGADRELASVLVSEILSAEPNFVRTSADLPAGLAIADVERDLLEFRSELDLLDAFGLDALGLRTGDDVLIPASASAINVGWFGAPFRDARRWSRIAFDYFAGDYFTAVAAVTNDPSNRFESMATGDARGSLQMRAATFLATRIASVREGTGFSGRLRLPRRRGEVADAIPGCQFVVTSDSPGLRVLWSGAYCVMPKPLGSPTSPVVGLLQSGHYIFGVDGGAYGNDRQWDDAIAMLPGESHIHLPY